MSLSFLSGCGLDPTEAALGTYELDTAAMRAAVLEEAGLEEPNSFVLSLVRTIESASGSLLLKEDLTFELRYSGQGTDDLHKGTWTLEEDKLRMVIQEEAGPATTVARLTDGMIMMTLGEHAYERRPFRKVKK